MSTDNSARSGGEFMLFGVRVRVDPMRKSVSLNNLSQYEVPQQQQESSNASAADVTAASAVVGYASADDAVTHQSSGSGRERKRGVPWTEEEHKLFLLGLQKVGKGDWRGISRNYVKTRTPTQVASHAQKYFLRKSNLNRRRRRSSLFDITTESVTPIPMEEKVDQEHKFRPLLPPAQLPLSENSILSGPQALLFSQTMCPISIPVQTDTPVENFKFGNRGYINNHDSEVVHALPDTKTRMIDFNLNQVFPENPSPLSLNLSLSLDQIQDQFSRRSGFGESMISVA